MKHEYRLVDADSHYYEVYDCFSRHIESRFKDRAIHPVHPDHIGRPYIGERKLKFSTAWPIDYMPAPGVFTDYYLGKEDLGSFTEKNIDPKDHPYMYRRQDRLQLMDEQGIEATVMLPTLAVAIEQDTLDDLPALFANVRAFNRWIEEDWGYGKDGRIYGIPMLSLLDPGEAAAEARRLAEAGARAVYIRPGPVYGRSPADPAYDPMWDTLQEADILVAFHIGDCVALYCQEFVAKWGEYPLPAIHRKSGLQWFAASGDRAITEMLAAMIFHNLFGRFPRLRCATIELGSSWVAPFMKAIDKAHRDSFNQNNPFGPIKGKPSEIFREHVWVVPFFEDDVDSLVDAIGIDHVLFGSDYPHPEGPAEPREYFNHLKKYSTADQRKIMRTNTAGLLGITA